jgi:hypothetical protein
MRSVRVGDEKWDGAALHDAEAVRLEPVWGVTREPRAPKQRCELSSDPLRSDRIDRWCQAAIPAAVLSHPGRAGGSCGLPH